MKITRTVVAGSLESNDVLVTVGPSETPGIHLELESIVLKQFGKRIEEVVLETLRTLHVDDAYIHIQDRGALNCTLMARVEVAIARARNGK